MAGTMIIVHGGVGEPDSLRDGLQQAVEAGKRRLLAGEPALEGALAAALVLEDDPRFNAGTGSWPGMDGETIEMDAGMMDSAGHLAAVSSIRRVKNPLLICRALLDTPQTYLTGQGAINFARKMGFGDYDVMTDIARERHEKTMRALFKKEKLDFPEEWFECDIAKYWNFDVDYETVKRHFDHGTIGAVARDGDGRFAVCVSTGGSCPMFLGRVGDVAQVGVGFFAGSHGAVAVTGIGEYTSRVTMARTVYQYLLDGVPLQEALDRGVALLPEEIDTGIIGVSDEGVAFSANRPMPTAAWRED